VASVGKQPNDQQAEGFTLIEILVAVTITGLVALGIMALLPNGYKQVTSAGRLANMDHLAQMKMDYLRTLPIDSSELGDGTHPTTAEWPYGEEKKYSVRWTVATPEPNVKDISVEVAYDYWEDNGLTVTEKLDLHGNPYKVVDQRIATYYTTITQ
jgi:prepilin-type N-terminal cleavage/methylation domain-containing protein